MNARRWLSRLEWRPRRRRLVKGLLLTLSVPAAVVVVVVGGFWQGSAETTCEQHALACGIFANASVAATVIVGGYLWVVLWMRGRVVRRYLRAAREDPASLFAGGSGPARQRLPDAPRHAYEDIYRWLRDVVAGTATSRVPTEPTARVALHHRSALHLVRADRGAGRTTFLIGLALHLARDYGLIPVPISLRDKSESLIHVQALARTRFLNEVDGWLWSENQGDHLWRKLKRDREIVVLIDGLDELLLDRVDRERREALNFLLREASEGGMLMVATCSREFDASLSPGPTRSLELPRIAPERAASYANLRLIDTEESLPEGGDERLEEVVRRAPSLGNPLYLNFLVEVLAAGNDGFLAAEGDDLLRAALLDQWLELRAGGRDRRVASLELAACQIAVCNTDALDFSEATAVDHLVSSYDFGRADLRDTIDASEQLRVGDVWGRGGQVKFWFRDAFLLDYFLARSLEFAQPTGNGKPLAEALVELGGSAARLEAAKRLRSGLGGASSAESGAGPSATPGSSADGDRGRTVR